MADELEDISIASNIPQGHAPMWVVMKRIQKAMESGGILEGLKWDMEGKVDVDGVKDLPCITPMFATTTESPARSSRSPNDEAHNAWRQNTPVDTVIEYTLRVTVQKKHGFFRRQPTTQALTKAGVSEWAMRVQDAIEMADDGSIDCSLERTLNSPPMFRTSEDETTQLSNIIYLEIELRQRYMHRGQRHYNFPNMPAPTPTVVVSSAGTVATNGVYESAGAHNGLAYYSHVDDATRRLEHNAGVWQLISGDSTVLYNTTSSPFDVVTPPTWVVVAGDAPAPSTAAV